MKTKLFCALLLVLSFQTVHADPSNDGSVVVRDHQNFPNNIPQRGSTSGNPQQLPSDGKDQPAPQTQPLTGTQIDIKPVFDPHCEKHDYPMLNEITNIQRIADTSQVAQFSFNSWLVSCKSQVITVIPYDQSRVHVGMFKSGLFHGLDKDAFQIAWLTEGNSTEVTLTFDKVKMFSEGVTERNLVLNFYPWGWTSPFAQYGGQARYFVWKVKVTKMPDQTVQLTFI